MSYDALGADQSVPYTGLIEGRLNLPLLSELLGYSSLRPITLDYVPADPGIIHPQVMLQSLIVRRARFITYTLKLVLQCSYTYGHCTLCQTKYIGYLTLRESGDIIQMICDLQALRESAKYSLYVRIVEIVIRRCLYTVVIVRESLSVEFAPIFELLIGPIIVVLTQHRPRALVATTSGM